MYKYFYYIVHNTLFAIFGKFMEGANWEIKEPNAIITASYLEIQLA